MSPAPVLALLRGRLDQLQGASREIALVILADPAAAAASSIATLAAAAGVSQASVTRLCTSLGLAGYADLRLGLAVAVASAEEPVGDIAEGDDLESVVRKIVHLDTQAVQDTAKILNVDSLRAAIDALAGARRIDVYGVGASGIVAADLVQKLSRIGRMAVAYTDAHLGLTSAATLDSSDVAIAVSHSGATPDTIDMLATARAGGAATIALTNDANSPLTDHAEHLLLTSARESVFRSGATASRLAQLVVVDCLFVGLAQRTFAASHAALENTWRAVRWRP